MSIPKEQRQLLINLMYLVLTALLALNVSAEVMNAFFSLDKGMLSTRKIVETSNDAIMVGINKQADAYPKPENEKWRNNAKQALQVADDFTKYIDGIRDQLFAKAGGENPKIPGQPKDIRNKDITTKMFINDGLGAEIENKVRETRQKFLELVENDPDVAKSLPLDVEALPAGVQSKNWPEYKFKQMPVAAIFPILGKMQSDAKNSATAVLNKCAEKVGGVDIKFDEFEPVVSAKKSYVISGDKYEADVFLSARSSTANNISINVAGASLPVEGGKAHYVATANGLGVKKYTVNINVRNPLDNSVKTYTKEFEYEVGQRSAAIQLDKMNVFYIGVENPITVSVAGVSSNDVRVSASGAGGLSISGGGGGHFTVKATTQATADNPAKITVSGGEVSQTFQYRVKRIPDPVATLSMRYKGGQMGNGEFKAQSGIIPVLENFDFEAKCDVVGFQIAYVAKRQDPVEKQNQGGRYNPGTTELVNRARPGDIFYFDEIKVKCPGDQAAREIPGMVFKIK